MKKNNSKHIGDSMVTRLNVTPPDHKRYSMPSSIDVPPPSREQSMPERVPTTPPTPSPKKEKLAYTISWNIYVIL